MAIDTVVQKIVSEDKKIFYEISMIRKPVYIL